MQRSPVQTLVWAKRKNLTYPVRTIQPSISEVKTRNHCGIVVECRTRGPEVPSSNPGVGKKKISHRSNQNNTTTNPSAPDLNNWNCQRWKTTSHHVTMVECRTRDSRVPQLKLWSGQNEYLSQVQSERYHHQSLCTRAKYLQLADVKSRSDPGTVVECRIRYPEVPSSNPGVVKRKSLTGPIRTIPRPFPLHFS